MKICLLNDSFPPVIDGVVNVVMNYADYLIRDHEAGVIVGTPRYPEADYSVYPYPVVPYRSFDTAGITSGYRTGNPFQEKTVSELAAFSPDLIHAHCPASATIIARLLREETGAPIVFTYHTKYDIDIERVVKTRLAAREGIRAMVRNIEATDDVWVVSEGAGRSLTALGFQGDWRVMPNGVDFRQGRADPEAVTEATGGYDLPDGVPVLLFVGRLMTYKGLPLILDALKMLSDAGQDFRMVFVGKGPDRELLEGFGLEPLSLKTHVETEDDMRAAVASLQQILDEPASAAEAVPASEERPSEERPAEQTPAVEVAPESVEVVEEIVPEEVKPVENVVPETRGKGRRWWIVAASIVAAAVLLLVAFVVLARIAPDFVDSILYTEEELDIIRQI